MIYDTSSESDEDASIRTSVAPLQDHQSVQRIPAGKGPPPQFPQNPPPKEQELMKVNPSSAVPNKTSVVDPFSQASKILAPPPPLSVNPKPEEKKFFISQPAVSVQPKVELQQEKKEIFLPSPENQKKGSMHHSQILKHKKPQTASSKKGNKILFLKSPNEGKGKLHRSTYNHGRNGSNEFATKTQNYSGSSDESQNSYPKIISPPPKTTLTGIKKANYSEQIKLATQVVCDLIRKINIKKYQKAKPEIDEKIAALTTANWKIGEKITKVLNVSITCHLCESPEIFIELSCQHILCKICAKKNLKFQENSRKQKSKNFLCPICEKKLSHEDLFEIFGNQNIKQKNNLEKAWIMDTFAQKRLVSCQKCLKMKTFTDYYEVTCMHMCSDCIEDSLRELNFNCLVCSVQFENASIINEIVKKCAACHKSLHVVGDYMKQVCDGHLLCGSCINSCLIRVSCIVCEKKLSRLEEIELNNFMFQVCKLCKQSLFRGYFQSLSESICMDCSKSN